MTIIGGIMLLMNSTKKIIMLLMFFFKFTSDIYQKLQFIIKKMETRKVHTII